MALKHADAQRPKSNKEELDLKAFCKSLIFNACDYITLIIRMIFNSMTETLFY